jgi:uncharacterized protein YqgV (UPF0045/DUF77 family)
MLEVNEPFNVNAALQLVPLGVADSYQIVDLAIDEIQKTGLPYEVGPFSTSVEASLEEILNLVLKIKNRVFQDEAKEILINIQIHARKDENVGQLEKVGKYKTPV